MCVNYFDHMDKRNNFRFIVFRAIVCINYIDQMDKRNNFRFILFRDHCVC